MGSVLTLLFEEWKEGRPTPNGDKFGCGFPYCSEYIDTHYITLDDVDRYDNIYFPISLNSDFFSIFSENFFSSRILKLIFEQKIKVLLLREHEGGGNHISFFNNLRDLVGKHSLKFTSFYLNFANKNLSNYYNDSLGDVGLNINVSDWLLEHTSLVVHRALENDTINDLGYKFELPSFTNEENRKYNFLCLNRVPKAHRAAFLARLYKQEILYKTDWSLLFSPYEFSPLFGEEKTEDGKNIFTIEHFSKYFGRKDLEKHEPYLKYIFYTKKKSYYEPNSKSLFNFFGDTKSTHFKESYSNSYCSLITETSFENNEEHITEKSFKPFINLHLGVFLAPYNHLLRIRSYGFETFESIWSEEYDTIIEPKDRMIEVCRTIDYLNNSDIKAIFSDAKPILEHNQEHFLNFWKRESCKKYFKSLISGN